MGHLLFYLIYQHLPLVQHIQPLLACIENSFLIVFFPLGIKVLKKLNIQSITFIKKLVEIFTRFSHYFLLNSTAHLSYLFLKVSGSLLLLILIVDVVNAFELVGTRPVYYLFLASFFFEKLLLHFPEHLLVICNLPLFVLLIFLSLILLGLTCQLCQIENSVCVLVFFIFLETVGLFESGWHYVFLFLIFEVPRQ